MTGFLKCAENLAVKKPSQDFMLSLGDVLHNSGLFYVIDQFLKSIQNVLGTVVVIREGNYMEKGQYFKLLEYKCVHVLIYSPKYIFLKIY